jgi:hypothetical protein
MSTNINIKVMLDVHHFTPTTLVALRGRFDRQGRFSKLNPNEAHKAFAHLESNDASSGFLRFVAQLGAKQPYRLVWTDHHAFCVRDILAENDWSASQIEFFVMACKSLAEHSGGSYEAVDYVKQAKSDRSLRFELESMGGTHRTPDIEDAAIVKMATDFRCDLIVSNDKGILAARVSTFVWKIEKLSDFIKAAARPAQAAA